MIVLIHGDDITKSRAYFLSLQKQYTPVLAFTNDTLTYDTLLQAVQGNSLFQQEQYIFIESMFGKKNTKEKDNLITLINSHTTCSFFLWEDKVLSSAQKAKFVRAEIKLFTLPKILFQFLDALIPGNSKVLVSLFHQNLEYQDVQMMFSMIVRHIRLLLALSSQEDNSSSIDELQKLAPWQKQKLQKQAKLFSQAQLISMQQKLFLLEYKQKTGILSGNLMQGVDFLLTSF